MTLPQGWTEATLAEIATFNPKHPADTNRDQPVSFVPMPVVDEELGAIVEATDRTLSDIWTGFTHFAEGDVIFAKITPCMENGKVAVATGLTNGRACGSTEFYVLRPEGAEAGLLWRFLRQRSFRDEAERNMSGAVGQRRVPRQFLENYPFPLPPLAEQRRIVAKLDALTARLARARAELGRVPALASKLRRQALSDAVEGRLRSSTGASRWGEEHRKALADRRLTYLRDRRGSRLRSDVGEAVEFLGGLRSGWLACRLADVISLRVGYAFKSSDFSKAEGVPLLRGANIAPGRVDWTDQARLPANVAAQFASYELIVGDIVIAMDRPVISTGLKIAQVRENDAGSLLVQRVANPRPTEWIDGEYLMIVLQSDLFMQQIENHATGTDLPHISGNDILTTPCPLPPLDVQRQIARAVRAAFARAERLEAEAARAETLLDRLEATILAKAFRGELVPQDPNDEPASVLLGRIRAQRAAAPKARRGRRTKEDAAA